MNANTYAEWKYSIDKKERFSFGKNWMNYINKLSKEQIEAAKISMNEFLTPEMLKGKSFIDIGSGSGLHSLFLQCNKLIYSRLIMIWIVLSLLTK